MSLESDKKFFDEMRDFVREHNIIFITAHQHPRPFSYQPKLDEPEILIIDYITLLGPKQ